MFRINNIKTPLDADKTAIKNQAADLCGLKPTELKDFQISKKSTDARNKNNVHFVYSVDFSTSITPKNIQNIEQISAPEVLKYKIKKTS